MNRNPKDGQQRRCGDTQNFRVQLYSESAALAKEFFLDGHEHGLPDLAAAEKYLRQTLPPTDIARLVSLSIGDTLYDTTILQFELEKA